MAFTEVSWPSIVVTAVCLTAVALIHQYNVRLKSVNYIPGMRPLLSPMSLIGAILPTAKWNPGVVWAWTWRKTSYMNRSHDVISAVPLLWGKPIVYVGSIPVARQIHLHDSKIQMEKPEELGTVLLLWGDNVVTANGEMWKRHRRLLSPAFSRDTYMMVNEETASFYREMISAEGWDKKTEFIIDRFNDIPQKLAFLVIARCGFDVRIPWDKAEASESDESLEENLQVVCETFIMRLLLPSWAYALPIKSVRSMDQRWKSLKRQMIEFVLSRKETLDAEALGETKPRKDLFSRLVGALDEEAKVGLSLQEVIGNTFTFMFAGHETTAHVLSATLALLAFYQEEQDKAIEEIRQHLSGNEDPGYDDVLKFTHVLACFLEALRLYPPAPLIIREVFDDITVEVEHPRKERIPIPKGNLVLVDIIGSHRDPHVFPEPDKFKPSRWYGTVTDHETTMFGIGPRTCIGRKFSQVEAVTFLALFLRDWKVDIVLKPNESRAQYWERVMESAGMIGLAFGVNAFSLKLSKRV